MHQPVTRADLREELQALESRLIEKMRDMQTEVLRALHDWARTIEVKLRRLP